MFSYWTCAGKSKTISIRIIWCCSSVLQAVFMHQAFCFVETLMMTSLCNQDWSKWQQILYLDMPRKFLPLWCRCSNSPCLLFCFTGHISNIISLLWAQKWYSCIAHCFRCVDAEAYEVKREDVTNGIFISFLKRRICEDEKVTVMLDRVAEGMLKTCNVWNWFESTK